MPTIAFLFRGDDSRVSDFDLICEAIFQTVLTLGPEGVFDVRSGGILLWRFSERITAVHRTLVAKRTSIGHTVRDDKELRATLAVAFAASVSAQRHHLDVKSLPRTLLRQPVECITVSDLPAACIDVVHKDLKNKLACYMGSFEVDRGDPLTLELAANGLIPFCQYQDRVLKWIVPFDHDPNVQPDISWARGLPFLSIELTRDDPQRIPSQPLSAVGEKNAQLLRSRSGPKHAEDVLVSLRDNIEDSKDTTEFELNFGEEEFGKPRANVRKLQDYCLNEQHTKPDGTPGDGRGKAYLFRRLLGITRNDWLFLGEQLVAGLEKALPSKTRKSAYGVQYDVTVPVTGRNGQTKLVKSGWIIRAGESPFLTTAYIADDAATMETGSLAHLIVDKPDGHDFWKRPTMQLINMPPKQRQIGLQLQCGLRDTPKPSPRGHAVLPG